MSAASRRTCLSVKSATLCFNVQAQETESNLISSCAHWLNDFFAPSRRRRRACCCDAIPLTRRFQRIRPRFGTVKIPPVNECCTGVHCGQKKNEQERHQPFHRADANRSIASCQCMAISKKGSRACAMPMFEENSTSVRGYGLRTYKSRQGRNAATVV